MKGNKLTSDSYVKYGDIVYNYVDTDLSRTFPHKFASGGTNGTTIIYTSDPLNNTASAVSGSYSQDGTNPFGPVYRYWTPLYGMATCNDVMDMTDVIVYEDNVGKVWRSNRLVKHSELTGLGAIIKSNSTISYADNQCIKYQDLTKDDMSHLYVDCYPGKGDYTAFAYGVDIDGDPQGGGPNYSVGHVDIHVSVEGIRKGSSALITYLNNVVNCSQTAKNYASNRSVLLVKIYLKYWKDAYASRPYANIYDVRDIIIDAPAIHSFDIDQKLWPECIIYSIMGYGISDNEGIYITSQSYSDLAYQRTYDIQIGEDDPLDYLGKAPYSESVSNDSPNSAFGIYTNGIAYNSYKNWDTSKDHFIGSCMLSARLKNPSSSSEFDTQIPVIITATFAEW